VWKFLLVAHVKSSKSFGFGSISDLGVFWIGRLPIMTFLVFPKRTSFYKKKRGHPRLSICVRKQQDNGRQFWLRN
jgi:hypothetical protein